MSQIWKNMIKYCVKHPRLFVETLLDKDMVHTDNTIEGFFEFRGYA